MDSNDSGRIIPWYDETTGSAFYHKTTPSRVVIGAACLLAMTGAMLIIMSYCFCKKLRNQTRLILFHLSLMDFGVALAHLVGIAVGFERYYIKAIDTDHDQWKEPVVSPAVSYSCQAEATLAIFCNNSSVLWTVSVAVYLHFRIVTDPRRSERFYRRLIYFFYLFNYGLPLIMTAWLLLTHRLGFAPYDSSGWCTIIAYRSPAMLHQQQAVHKRDKFAEFIGYDVLIILTIVIIPFLYFSIRTHAKEQLTAVVTENQTNLRNKHSSIDLKFTAIPLAFILLRIWSLIVSMMYVYIGVNDDKLHNYIKIPLIYLSGIGDTSQGTANGIIFILFTAAAREMFLRVFFCACSKKRQYKEIDDFSNELSASHDDEKTPIMTNTSAHQKYEAGGRTLYIIQSH